TGVVLTWAVPTLQPGGAATLSYTVTVNADAIGATLVNVATPGTGGECTLPEDCTTTHPTPSWVLEKTADPVTGSAVDVGSTITYTLTAANRSSAPVSGATAIDTLPTGVTLVEPLDPGLTPGPDGTLTWAIPDIAVGGAVTVTYQVTVDASAAGTTLTNVVVPGTPDGICVADEDCTTTHDVTQLIVDVADDCRLDAAFLTYAISSKNVPDAENLPVTVTWRTAAGTVVRVDAIPAGQLTGELLWPGMVLNGDEVAVGWPGWRSLVPSDFPLAPGAEIYGTQIRDTSLASEAYRNAMTVTFEMNPQAVATVDYPAVTPAGCAVPRDPDLHVVKTADRSTIKPGEAFSYAIDVRNDSTLGVAYPVTLSDPIPPQVKVTAIDTAESGFPHWQDCAIVGSDADGYGGTLTCDLSAALGVSSSAPPITLSAVSSTHLRAHE
ncbi:hypothetical protein, partial [Blautia wexlerae]|uniref:DUF7927 domain-containing protein n=1 Tax=Blautia wexlerae TaxID=418240 RepID=UPI0034A1FC63